MSLPTIWGRLKAFFRRGGGVPRMSGASVPAGAEGVTACDGVLFGVENVLKEYRKKQGVLSKLWQQVRGRGAGDGAHRAIKVDKLEIPRGKLTAIVGPFGCGKTTLLHLLGFQDIPTAGADPKWRITYYPSDRAPFHYATEWANETMEFRKHRMCSFGFIHQKMPFWKSLKALDNIWLPLDMQNRTLSREEKEEYKEWARGFLRSTSSCAEGDAAVLEQPPETLSGGQRRLVGAMRATVFGPSVVFADEPESSLDPMKKEAVVELLRMLVGMRKASVIWVTHDIGSARDVAEYLIVMKTEVVEGKTTGVVAAVFCKGNIPDEAGIRNLMGEALRKLEAPPSLVPNAEGLGHKIGTLGRLMAADLFRIRDDWGMRPVSLPTLSLALFIFSALWLCKGGIGFYRVFQQERDEPQLAVTVLKERIPSADGRDGEASLTEEDLGRLKRLRIVSPGVWDTVSAGSFIEGVGERVWRWLDLSMSSKWAYFAPEGDSAQAQKGEVLLGAHGVFNLGIYIWRNEKEPPSRWIAGQDNRRENPKQVDCTVVDPEDPYLTTLRDYGGLSLEYDPYVLFNSTVAAVREAAKGDYAGLRPLSKESLASGRAFVIITQTSLRGLGYSGKPPKKVKIGDLYYQAFVTGELRDLAGCYVCRDVVGGSKSGKYIRIYVDGFPSAFYVPAVATALTKEYWFSVPDRLARLIGMERLVRYVIALGVFVGLILLLACIGSVTANFLFLFSVKSSEMALLTSFGASKRYPAVLYFVECLAVWVLSSLGAGGAVFLLDGVMTHALGRMVKAVGFAEMEAAFRLPLRGWGAVLCLGLVALGLAVLFAWRVRVARPPAEGLKHL